MDLGGRSPLDTFGIDSIDPFSHRITRQEGDSVRLKTFRAFTLDEALAAVHADLGSDAAILHTRTFRRGGLFGIGGRELVEIIASEGEPDPSILPVVTRAREDDPDEPADRTANSESTPFRDAGSVGGRARQAYASEAARTAPSSPDVSDDEVEKSSADAPPTSGSLVVDRDRTRALARAMEIRLERQRAAREAAGVQSSDDLIGADAESALKSEMVMDPDHATPAAIEPASKPQPNPASAATTFVIGPGGILVPQEDRHESGERDESSGQEETPRVIALDPSTVTQKTSQDLPVAKTETPTPTMVEALVAPEAPSDVVEEVRVPEEPVVMTEAPVEAVIPEPEETGTAGKPIEPVEAHTPVQPSSATTVPSPEPSPEPPPTTASRNPDPELRRMGETVRRVLDREVPVVPGPTSRENLGFADPLASAYAEMIGQEFSKDLADRVVETLEGTLDEQSLRDPAEVRRALLREIADLVPTEESLEVVVPRDGRPRTIAFVGPTGVGKTTTLAKIAATLSLREGLKVGLVTADTYRISAVEQLRTYAEILGCRLEVAGDPATMKKVLADCDGLDAVLIDTPGRSQNDADSLADLRTIMDAARPHETHLVLAGTAAERVLLREAEAFAGLGPDRVVLTKLDEAVAFGMLVSVVRRIGRRISWVTTGQEVPRDVEWATGSRIADLVLGGAVKS